MTETLGDLLRRLGEETEDLDEGVQVGDGFGGTWTKPDPLMGAQDPSTWVPSSATQAAAASYGYGTGPDGFFPMVTPKGRRIGFPFPTLRPGQLEGIDAVLDQFQAGKHVLFEAGTGYGKSPMEIGVASYFETAYLLIGRNDLVDQWERDFEHFQKIGFYKARHRFDCKLITNQSTGQPATCSSGKNGCDKKRKDWDDDMGKNPCLSCPYAVNRDISLSRPYTVMTLSLGMTIFRYLKEHPAVTRRKLLVIDECSELESEIMRFFEFSLATKTILRAVGKSTMMKQFFPKGDPFYTRWPKVDEEMRFEDAIVKNMNPDEGEENGTLRSCIAWALDIAHIANIYKSFFKDDGSEHASEVRDICSGVIRQAKAMAETVDAGTPYYATVEEGDFHSDDLYRDYTVKVKPLEARTLLERMFSPFAEHLLFVSATTGTASMFKSTHGMQAPLVKVEIPTGFPVENRPVYVASAGNMSKRTQDVEAPNVMKKMLQIAGCHLPNSRFSHADQKGIIHTYNNKITDMVAEALRRAGMGNRMSVLRGGGRQRELAMELFRQTSEPMILVSPSAMLGLDLKEDLGRWQIIVKVPYANLGEPSVGYRKDAINGWYEWQTAKDMIQTFGRIVRSDIDWGYTYILDDAFRRFYQGNQDLFPGYIQKAIRFLD